MSSVVVVRPSFNFDDFRDSFLRYFDISDVDLYDQNFYCTDVCSKFQRFFVADIELFQLDKIKDDFDRILGYFLYCRKFILEEFSISFSEQNDNNIKIKDQLKGDFLFLIQNPHDFSMCIDNFLFVHNVSLFFSRHLVMLSQSCSFDKNILIKIFNNICALLGFSYACILYSSFKIKDCDLYSFDSLFFFFCFFEDYDSPDLFVIFLKVFRYVLPVLLYFLNRFIARYYRIKFIFASVDKRMHLFCIIDLFFSFLKKIENFVLFENSYCYYFVVSSEYFDALNFIVQRIFLIKNNDDNLFVFGAKRYFQKKCYCIALGSFWVHKKLFIDSCDASWYMKDNISVYFNFLCSMRVLCYFPCISMDVKQFILDYIDNTNKEILSYSVDSSSLPEVLFFCVNDFGFLLDAFCSSCFCFDFLPYDKKLYVLSVLSFCRSQYMYSRLKDEIRYGRNSDEADSAEYFLKYPELFIERSKSIFCMFDFSDVRYPYYSDDIKYYTEIYDSCTILTMKYTSANISAEQLFFDFVENVFKSFNRKIYLKDLDIFKSIISILSRGDLYEGFAIASPIIEGIIFDELFKKYGKYYIVSSASKPVKNFQRIVLSGALLSNIPCKKELMDDLVDTYGVYFIILYDYIFLNGNFSQKMIKFNVKSQSLCNTRVSNVFSFPSPVGWGLRHIISHGLVLDIKRYEPYLLIALMWIMLLYTLSPEEIKNETKTFNDEIIRSGNGDWRKGKLVIDIF